MFKKRSLEVKVIKTPKTEVTEPLTTKKSLAEITASVQKIATTVIRETGKVVAVCIVLDAARKIALAGLTQQS